MINRAIYIHVFKNAGINSFVQASKTKKMPTLSITSDCMHLIRWPLFAAELAKIISLFCLSCICYYFRMLLRLFDLLLSIWPDKIFV